MGGKGAAKGAKGGAPSGAADPVAVELLKAQSAAKCAEQLKVSRCFASVFVCMQDTRGGCVVPLYLFVPVLVT